MRNLLRTIFVISKVLNYIAGIAVTLMIAITVIDVFLRAIGHAVVGAYEVIGMICAPFVVGFAIPLSSWNRKHVSMDIVVSRFGLTGQHVFYVVTRIVCILLFFFIGYNLLSVASGFRTSGEVTQMLHIPFWWVTYGVAVACFIECVVFICDIIRISLEEK